jgi:hypothetical protein
MSNDKINPAFIGTAGDNKDYLKHFKVFETEDGGQVMYERDNISEDEVFNVIAVTYKNDDRYSLTWSYTLEEKANEYFKNLTGSDAEEFRATIKST